MMTRNASRTGSTVRIAVTAVATTALLGTAVHAAPVVWDGNGSPDSNGNWSDALNWDTDSLPVSGDTVTLPSVTSGTRVITMDAAGATVSSLTLEQSNADGINKLSLASNLTITTGNGYKTSLSGGATADNVVLDLNGYTLKIAANAALTIGGTVNFNAPGSAYLVAFNGSANDSFTISGKIVVNAGNGNVVRLGRDIVSGNQTGGLGVNTSSSGSINIQSGTLSIDESTEGLTGTKNNGPDNIGLTNGNSITIASGAALRLAWNITTPSSSTQGGISLTNNASRTITQAGAIEHRVYHDANNPAAAHPASQITNNGSWVITGTNAIIRRLTTAENVDTIIVPTFTNNTNGTIRGSGSADALEFDEEVADGTRRMTISNAGIIAPGAGTNQSGLSSVGTLTLRDINLTSLTNGKLEIDVGGTASGEYDVLSLANGVTDGAGAGTIDLSATGDSLRVTLVNGFTPGNTSFALPILTYGSVVLNDGVGFDALYINGVTQGTTFTVPDGGTWSIEYGPTSALLVYSVPEPGSLALAGISAMALLTRRRRA